MPNGFRSVPMSPAEQPEREEARHFVETLVSGHRRGVDRLAGKSV
jgi:hypothetical protein